MASVEEAGSGPLAAAIRTRLREEILRGDFAPGERLREVEIAARHEVRRGAVCEALVQLEHEGLVMLRRTRGAVVARMSRANLEEVYSLRLALELLSFARAARLGTESDFGGKEDVLHE